MTWRLLASLLPLLLGGAASGEGSVMRGESVYYRCIGCHSLDRNRTGPKHCGLIGRRAGGVDGYYYSAAMRASGIVWNRDSLDAFLRAPLDVVPGTRMGYAGVSDPGERADLIDYLAWASTSAPECAR